MKRIVLYALPCLGILACLGCGSKEKKEEKTASAATIHVRTATLKPDSFVEYGEYYGKTEGEQQATLVNYTGGRVDHIAAQPGKWVKKGTHLARIDAEKVQTRYETALLNEEIAKKNYERTQTHFEAGNASQLQLDQQKLAWMNAKASRIEAQRMREGALCIAPFSGMVTHRFIELHKEVAPNSPTFAMARLSRIKVSIYVPEGDISSVDSNDPAFVILPALDSTRKWPAQISTVARSTMPETHKYKVDILIDNKDRKINPGLTAQVRIAIQQLDSQIVVPTDAIITSGIQHFVYVVANNAAKKRLIEPAQSNETHTRVTDGLQSGDRLIIAGQQRVKHNTPVEVKN